MAANRLDKGCLNFPPCIHRKVIGAADDENTSPDCLPFSNDYMSFERLSQSTLREAPGLQLAKKYRLYENPC